MQDILEVANYLTLVDVVDLCSSHILANLTADNALAVLSLPDRIWELQRSSMSTKGRYGKNT